jgi:mannosyltransferase
MCPSSQENLKDSSNPPLEAGSEGLNSSAWGKAWPWLMGALVLACLRFWRLGEWSFWIDEVYTYADARWGLQSDQLWNPMGYAMLLKSANLFGERPDEFGLRLLPALVGWGCVPLTWWAFRTWVGDRRAALVALLLAASSWHIFWSQNARFYTIAMACSLLGAGWVLRGLMSNKRSVALLGLLVTAAAAAFHVTAALMVPALCLSAWWSSCRSSASPEEGSGVPARSVAKFLMLLLIIVGALGSPWLWSALVHHGQQKGIGDWMHGPLHLMQTLGFFYTPLFGAAALVGGWWAWHTKNATGQFALIMCVVVLGASLLISTRMLMTAQYTFCLLPWVLLLAVLPLEALGSGPQGRALFRGGALLLIAPTLANSLLYFTVRGGERPRWREAYTYVDEQREEGDLILGMAPSVGEFYLGVDQPDPRRPRVVAPLGDYHTQGPRRWNRHDRRIWVVVRPQWIDSLGESDAHMLRVWLANECRLVKSFPLLMEGRDLALQVYLRDV